ncbi:Beta-xylosidase [Tsuneonella dongtanensis]|uniref:Beta-xylosidase n=1 Tax=Tsuneonella dongtanensis TaxID=692370 RepID=A0A1B2AB33_9SPHN|nr:family 43 glycosylhydrolase [Tsuneonella dongtanensis]ANY19342.1 Beta-xylosidase [Tsuneonella dongtanensis]
MRLRRVLTGAVAALFLEAGPSGPGSGQVKALAYLCPLAFAGAALAAHAAPPAEGAVPVSLPAGDLADGTFRNPVLVGAQGDVSVVRDGEDFYATFGKTLDVWHSRDLVNWEKIATPNLRGLGSPWAPDIVKHAGTWYIYTTLVDRSRPSGQQFMNVVITAPRPEGPWSEPVDLDRYNPIDPGHATDASGKRYIMYSAGRLMPLTDDGKALVGDIPERLSTYVGWPYPADWQVECFCLEAPKLLWHDGWLHMLSAQGGTAGPPTAHMAISARARDVHGPWQNNPHNALVHGISRTGRFVRMGHGQLVDDANGDWWMLFTGYNPAIGPGKMLLVLPIAWDADGWPMIKPGADVENVMAKPAGTAVPHQGSRATIASGE